MKPFDNLTTIKRENAIKVGTSVPADAAPIAWFSSEEVSPSSNLSVLDLSNLIPENRVDNEKRVALAYADELGILRDFENNSVFKTNDLTISNKFLSSPNRTERVIPENINPNDFIHYFYVSRFFTVGSPGFSLLTMHDFVEPDKFLSLSIKVIDQNGFEYADINSGRKKYRILLEPYLVEANSNKTEIPYRIIVLLDSDYNPGLYLVYDKIEIDDSGSFFNQQLRYSEKINPVKYFTETPEESFVIDYNYQNSRNFSIKKYAQKTAELLSDVKNINGYQIFTPSKAIEDNRSFEVFNWRLIARSNSSINLDEANYGQEFNEDGSPKQKDIKVGVLYSSSNQKTLATVNPYIFFRLQNSSFNFSRYNFINPAQTQSIAARATAEYWLVDIDSQQSLANFDFLAWSPIGTITNGQAAKIQTFLDNNGTILLDLSSNAADATQISSLLSTVKNPVRPSSITTNYQSTLLNRETSGGWSITSDIFENSSFGIYGSSKLLKSNTDKSYTYFSQTASNQVVRISSSQVSGSKDLVMWLSRNSQGSMLKKHNIIAVTFPLMEYCNSIYSVSNPDVKVDENVSNTSTSLTQDQIYSSVVEGPLKFLYNTICYALYSKAHSNRNIDARSSLFNFVTEWDSSWVLDEEALLEDERDRYFKIAKDNDGEGVYVRDILPLSQSIVSFYKDSLSKNMPAALVQRLSVLDYSNIEFFIEVTNPDVTITNATLISAAEADLASSYTLYKVTNPNLPVMAFTTVQSPKLIPYPNTGYYAVVEKPVSSSSLRSIRGFFDISNYLKSYNFDLDSGYYYFQSRDKSFNLSSTLRTAATVAVSGLYFKQYTVPVITGFRTVPVSQPAVAPVTSPTTTNSSRTGTGTSGSQRNAQPLTQPREAPVGFSSCLNYKSAIDNGILRTTSSASPENAFLYTGDIEIGNSTRTWGNTSGTISVTSSSRNSSDPISIVYSDLGALGLIANSLAKNFPQVFEQEKSTPLARSIYSDLGSLGNIVNSLNGNMPKAFSIYSDLSALGGVVNSLTGNISQASSVQQPSSVSAASIYSDLSALGGVVNSLTGNTPKALEQGPSSAPAASIYSDLSILGSIVNNLTNSVPQLASQGSSNATGDYVRYIQYTLVQDGASIAVDGVYGPKTASAVRAFQQKYQQRYIDGTVDSETKAYFALKVWKAKTQAEFDAAVAQCRSNASTRANADKIIQYMQAARNSGDASAIGVLNYNKITFTGFTGPSVASDVLFFEIPASVQKLKQVKIAAGTFNNFKVTHYGYGSANSENIFASTYRNTTQTITLNNSNEIVINVPDISYANCRYFWVRIEGGALGARYGFAEGFSISNITASGTRTATPPPTTTAPPPTNTPPVIPPETRQEPIWGIQTVTEEESITAYVNVTFNENVSNVTPASPYYLRYDTATLPRKTSYTINSIQYNVNRLGRQNTFTSPSVTFNTTNYQPEQYVTINLSSISSIVLNSVNILTVKSEDNVNLPTNVIDASVSGNLLTLTTFGTSYYNDSEVQVISNSIDSYLLVNDNNVLINYEKNSISISDGVLRFCDQNKKPVGIITATEIRNLEINGNEEVDYKYGYFFLRNNLLEEQGLIYGFYDNVEKEFIGRTISYINLVERGLDNVYIAVCAIDADGNTLNTQDYIGPTPSTTFKPVNLPIKILAPVYSVSYSNSSYIKVGELQNDLNKHTAWPLPVSNGSFVKKINGTSNFFINDIQSQLRSQVQKDYYAIYNTTGLKQVNWSSIYGFGHYDIRSETPIVISDRAIKTRLRPILNWNHPVDYKSSIAGVTIPEVSISTRDSLDSEWTRISLSNIRSVDCDTGIIEFNSSIINSDPNLTKVDYSISSKNSLIYQIDGFPVPLNPILNREEISYNKPLYIYIVPIEMYESTFDLSTEYFKKVEEYSVSSPVNFTYDNSIFNPNSTKYNRLALPIAIIYSVNNPKNISPTIIDLRTRGGGIKNGLSKLEIGTISEDSLSYWDVYSPVREAYAKGGYVILRIPEEVKNNFNDPSIIYDIIRNNLTAGVAFDLQNMNGENWRLD